MCNWSYGHHIEYQNFSIAKTESSLIFGRFLLNLKWRELQKCAFELGIVQKLKSENETI